MAHVLAINDISCVGKCSLSVTLPILSACGVECSVLPTAILSTHTGGFTGYSFLDMTDEIPSILAHWKRLGLQFDYIYSGYLGNIAQIDLVMEIAQTFLREGGQLIVDPVMGDNGMLYDGFTQTYVKKMRQLCQLADYILPNETEACYLAQLPYPLGENAPLALEKLAKICPQPIVTGLAQQDNVSVYYCEKEKTLTETHKNVQGFFCGAGDTFASAFVACLAKGKTQAEAISIATQFITDCIRRSAKEVSDKRYGLHFEKEIFSLLKKLSSEG